MLENVLQHRLDLVFHPDRDFAADQKIRDLDLCGATGEAVFVESDAFSAFEAESLPQMVGG